MKTKIFSLVLALVLIASCVLVLASCKKPGGGKDNGKDPVLDLDENVTGGLGSGDVTMVTDPNSPEAGADTEGNYVHG